MNEEERITVAVGKLDKMWVYAFSHVLYEYGFGEDHIKFLYKEIREYMKVLSERVNIGEKNELN